MEPRIRVLQIAKDAGGKTCGLSLFAEQLSAQMGRAGVEMMIGESLLEESACDVVLLHYHDELFCEREVVQLAKTSNVPFVLFAHSEVNAGLLSGLHAVIAMCPGMVQANTKPVHTFPHPAWVPEKLEDRSELRHAFGLPTEMTVIGSHGYLKFERQFVEIIRELLPRAREHGLFIQLWASPWRLGSPGLIEQLQEFRREQPDHFGFTYQYLDPMTLNRCLQSCDLLWCWTAAPSSPYASGVISDQYASGTRIIAAEKLQHAHVLKLPNVVAAPDRLDRFVHELIVEGSNSTGPRHDPMPVSWEHCIFPLARFLKNIAMGSDRHD